MKAVEIVKLIMNNQQIKVVTLASRLGIRAGTLSQRFMQNNFGVENLNQMLRAMDYKITIVPRETRVPENGFEVE